MDQIPERDGQANTLERFEEDVLIFTHAVPKERKVTVGPKLLQQFPKSSPRREIGLELLKVGCVATGGRSSFDSVSERTCSKTCPNITSVSLTVPRVCISSRCNTTLPRNENCTNEPCRQSNPCVLRGKTNPRPKKSLPM